MEPTEASTGAAVPNAQPPTPRQDSWRASPTRCALVAIGGTAVVGCALMALSVRQYESYGVTLFCLSPAICGFLANVLHQWARPATDGRIWVTTRAVVGVLAVLVSLILLVSLKLEGFICVLMALPFALGLAALGAFVGEGVAALSSRARPLPVLGLVLVLYPAAQEYEVRHPAPNTPHLVTTQLAVAAPPARVWAALMQPVQYPPATGLFRAGVVYPVSTAFARDAATGARTLVCRYSQGLAHLPVVGWVPGRSLTFAVPAAHMPAPMREISPYPQIHAPHLHGYFQVDSGTFRLRPLPGGRTLLEARTVYRHTIGPRSYWQLWSDYLLDAMHQRVLATIKTQAERAHE
ncbi:MAG: hypothetical protein ACRYG7_52295 [Janthinobacterium lividum]